MKTNTAALMLNGKVFRGKIEADYILCADGGYDIATSKGIIPDAILGDMDSITVKPEEGVEIIRFDVKKDETDGELAIKYLVDKGFGKIEVYGAEGGRLDHVLGNLGMMQAGAGRGVEIVAVCNDYDIYMIGEGVFKKDFTAGDEVSLVPFGGDVHISLTKGLEYVLEDEVLYAHKTRGISNVVTEGGIEVGIKSGRAFLFRIYK